MEINCLEKFSQSIPAGAVTFFSVHLMFFLSRLCLQIGGSEGLAGASKAKRLMASKMPMIAKLKKAFFCIQLVFEMGRKYGGECYRNPKFRFLEHGLDVIGTRIGRIWTDFHRLLLDSLII